MDVLLKIGTALQKLVLSLQFKKLYGKHWELTTDLSTYKCVSVEFQLDIRVLEGVSRLCCWYYIWSLSITSSPLSFVHCFSRLIFRCMAAELVCTSFLQLVISLVANSTPYTSCSCCRWIQSAGPWRTAVHRRRGPTHSPTNCAASPMGRCAPSWLCGLHAWPSDQWECNRHRRLRPPARFRYVICVPSFSLLL